MIDDGPFASRSFGVLLHPSSLPGRDEIGTLGAEALDFVDWLSTTGATIWQILPLNINGQGDSPYFSPSAFAGNPWLIDLDDLVEHGLIDATGLSDRVTDARIPYDAMRERKRPVLWAAARRFLDDPGHPWRAGFDAYVETSDWLAPTCHFLALEDLHGGAAWWEWPDAIRRREPEAIRRSRVQLADEIARWEAVLYFFEVQWCHLRSAAHERGIRILGDLPIYVAPDSADVWLHQDQFQLDDDGAMVVQSGVPPDYFSTTGQLWRNPLYRWDVMAADGYAWWISRLRRALELSDVVRIDHFRAMSAYWEVPGDADDALGGRWVDGPGQPFLDAVRAAFPSMPFVAEDLGTLDDDVYRLRDDNRLPGMRVIQLGFDGTPGNPHLPDALVEACVVYTGTHDNDTIAGWWNSLDGHTRAEAARAYQIPPDADVGRAVWSFIEAAIASRAVAAVIPMQDLLGLDERSRMNTPSTATGNWSWRMPPDVLGPELAASMRRLGDLYDRS
jgi:4-alpha-glucanotransferase